MTKKAINLIVIVMIIIVMAVILILGRNIFFAKPIEETPAEEAAPTISADTLVISEVVTSSRSSFIAPDGSAPDWIELYNGSKASVSLSGLSLSDDPKEPGKYPLPGVNLDAGEYIIILCDGKETEDGYAHASFRLSSDGDHLGLYSGATELIALDIPALGKDISYGIDADGSYRYFAAATPAAENSAVSSATADFSELSAKLTSDTLVINEYQTDNLNTAMDRDGEHGKWVEVKNVSDAPLDLSAYGLSDTTDNLGKWHFPAVTLAPDECRIVFLSGKASSDELHADFSLGSDETVLALSMDSVGLIDLIAVDHTLPQNCSYGRTSDGWAYFASPTPNQENLTKSFSRLDISEDKYLPEV